MSNRDDVVRRYLDYLDACNRQSWDDLQNFLAESVLVNGQARTRPEYVADVMVTTTIFPDYRWELRRAVWDGEWLAVHLHDSGTRARVLSSVHQATERASKLTSSTMYRIIDGLIHEVEGTADNARLCN
ncbi:MAG TPA: ester cyclase [Thermomicrobiales bacterium]|nr:ester cyclase [Thermomicrobiales bacterium]